MALLRWLVHRAPQLRFPAICLLLAVAGTSKWLPPVIPRLAAGFALAHLASVVVAGVVPYLVISGIVMPASIVVLPALFFDAKWLKSSRGPKLSELIVSALFWMVQLAILPVQAYLLIKFLPLDNTVEVFAAAVSVLEYLFFLALAHDKAKKAALKRNLWSLVFLFLVFIPVAPLWMMWVGIFADRPVAEPLRWEDFHGLTAAEPLGCLLVLLTAAHLLCFHFLVPGQPAEGADENE